jgi:hypothetical protein
MQKNHPYQRYYFKVKPALKIKLEEFIMLGLNEVTEENIWTSLTRKKWKKPEEHIHIYEIVADILSLSSNQFMTFQMVEAYKAPSLFEPLSEGELKELLRE